MGINPEDYFENIIGVGFIDIADYSFISRFLSTKENQTILNGLFSAFNIVLKKFKDQVKIEEYIETKYSLFSIFMIMGQIQDRLKAKNRPVAMDSPFKDYSSFISGMTKYYKKLYNRSEQWRRRKAWFYEVQFNQVFEHIKSSILEYQVNNIT